MFAGIKLARDNASAVPSHGQTQEAVLEMGSEAGLLVSPKREPWLS